MADQIEIVDRYGYITDRAVREAYERISDSPIGLRSGYERMLSAEAFLKLIVRYADRGVRLIPEKKHWTETIGDDNGQQKNHQAT